MNNYNQFKTTVLQPPIESKQYVSIVYNERLAENVNGSYESELIHTRTWNDVVDVEVATFEG